MVDKSEKQQKSLEDTTMAEFFKQDAATVAQKLLGADIVRTFDGGAEVRGRIKEVSAWNGTYGERPQKFDDYEPGTVSVSCKFGKYMIDVTCGDGASCVTLIAADFDFDGKSMPVQGAGKLSSALKVTPDVFDGYVMGSTSALRVEGSAIPASEVKQRKKSNVPPNCAGFFYRR